MIEQYYQLYYAHLLIQSEFTHASWREFAGKRFLYVSSPLPLDYVVSRVLEAGDTCTASTKLRVECVYVRSKDQQHVFLFRFLVPNEKQFCCGNLCEDCYYLREKNS